MLNRARPKQVASDLNSLDTKTGHTPAYPAGHTTQAYYLAKKLSIRYPEKKDILMKIAERCGKARLYAGLHYPSDNEFGRRLGLFLE